MIWEGPRRRKRTQIENAGSGTLISLCYVSALQEEALAGAYSHEWRDELGKEPIQGRRETELSDSSWALDQAAPEATVPVYPAAYMIQVPSHEDTLSHVFDTYNPIKGTLPDIHGPCLTQLQGQSDTQGQDGVQDSRKPKLRAWHMCAVLVSLHG